MKRLPRPAVLLTVSLMLPASIAPAPAEDIGAETATHVEVDPIGKSPGGVTFEKLATFCLSAEGNLLVCDSKAKTVFVQDFTANIIRVLKPKPAQK